MKHRHIEIFDIGRQVLCDSCGDDYTDKPDSGGVQFQSKAYCPVCAVGLLAAAQRYGEESLIRGHCPPGVAYADWVRGLRDGHNTVTITTITNKEDDNGRKE